MGQLYSTTAVDYSETPPVGGQRDPVWADCTGTVYAALIRPENAVHSLEHGVRVDHLRPGDGHGRRRPGAHRLVAGRPGLMLSPYQGQGAAISLQAWDHQLRVRSAADPKLAQFAYLLAFNPDSTPEPGATCESPGFLLGPPPVD
ncbi:Protein of unknown function [Modestobacter sp. DSM 44400]|uniref:DUF3105 domain-containing protein n=1 Tax=Modestobacter sp. DSM 44400 TaxID=1550230 RepID=UPI000899A799|nr:DUF3105 domain-containing protein [Modestobacter sp. DSM 44400]SDX61873.1 Protein of unknown function [Modestobacter sp. DSM 44400]